MITKKELQEEQKKVQSTLKKLESEKEEIKASETRTIEDVILDIGREKALLNELQKKENKKNEELRNIKRLRAIPDLVKEKYGLTNQRIISRTTYDLVLIAGILRLEIKKRTLIGLDIDISKLCSLYGVKESNYSDENMTRLNAVFDRQLSIIKLKEVEKVE